MLILSIPTWGGEDSVFSIMPGTYESVLHHVLLLLLFAKQCQDVPSTSLGSVSKWKLSPKSLQGNKMAVLTFYEPRGKEGLNHSASVASSQIKVTVVWLFFKFLH